MRIDYARFSGDRKVLGDRRLREREFGEHVGATALRLGCEQPQDAHSTWGRERLGDSRNPGVIHSQSVSSLIADER